MRFLINVILFALCLPQSAKQVSAQSVNDESGNIKINRVAELTIAENEELFSTNVDLGNLPVGKNAVVTLTLINSSDTDIRFSNVSKKCSCSQFQARQYVVPAHGQADVTLTIKIPARHRSKTVTNSIVFVQQGNSVIRANLMYKLDGLLAFSEVVGIVRFDSEQTIQSIEIPFLSSHPVEFQQVQAEASDELQECTFHFEKTDTGGVLTVTVPEKIVADGNVRGEIYLTYAETNQKDAYLLAVKDNRVTEISPKIVRFKNQGNQYHATAIVSIPGLKHSVESGQGFKNLIRCRFHNSPIETNIKQLTNRTFRVGLSIDKNQLAKITEEFGSTTANQNYLVWEIGKEDNARIETPFITGDE